LARKSEVHGATISEASKRQINLIIQAPAEVSPSMTTLLKTDLGATPLIGRGKVRDLYAVGDALLMVATDRISAFDHVLGTGIPGKGKILTQISLFWFDLLRDIVPNHLIATEVKDFPEPLFTPSTKSQDGTHDENISFAAVEKTVGAETAKKLRDLTLAIYNKAGKHAESRGLILADTKFEFGQVGDTIVLADEVLTPDSSRFWEASQWDPGGAQPSFDKQFVRDYLESIHWNKQAPAPSLPDDVVRRTLDKYLEAFRRLTGRDLDLTK
jgi:phosphoribosylaminoimidazole-succinocarboxamide synthase